jgi:glycogen operon protein
MGEADWNFPDGRFLAYVLAEAREGGEPLYVVLNGADEAVEIVFPEWPGIGRWKGVLDTANGQQAPGAQTPGAKFDAQPRCVLAFAGAS